MKRFQKVPMLKFYFSIVIVDNGAYKAMIPVDYERHQHFYLMDQDGQHEFVPFSVIHAYHYVANSIVYLDVNRIKTLLFRLNSMDDTKGSIEIISEFNACTEGAGTVHDKMFLNSSCKSVRFSSKGFYF